MGKWQEAQSSYCELSCVTGVYRAWVGRSVKQESGKGGQAQIIKGLECVFQRCLRLPSKQWDHGKIPEKIIPVAGLIIGLRREEVTDGRTTC